MLELGGEEEDSMMKTQMEKLLGEEQALEKYNCKQKVSYKGYTCGINKIHSSQVAFDNFNRKWKAS